MDTALQEMVYQTLILIGSGILGIIGIELKSYIKHKRKIMGYEFDNDKLERIIDKSIDYAEGKGKEFYKIQAKKMAGSDKLDYAREYINLMDPKKVEELGGTLDKMITRAVVKKYK